MTHTISARDCSYIRCNLHEVAVIVNTVSGDPTKYPERYSIEKSAGRVWGKLVTKPVTTAHPRSRMHSVRTTIGTHTIGFIKFERRMYFGACGEDIMNIARQLIFLMRRKPSQRLVCCSSRFRPDHSQMATRIPSLFGKTRWLFFVRLVDKSKGSKTKRFAFDKPQLRRRRPVREEPSSPSHDERLD